MKSFIVGENDNELRLSRFVVKVTSNLPNDVLHKSFRNKRIKVNGTKAKPETRLRTGDYVELYINDEYFSEKPQKTAALTKHNIADYGTIYEDNMISVLYKPAGLLSHPGEKNKVNLLDSYVAKLIKSGEYNPANELSFSPAICNRLDYGTEGLVLAAKTYPALRDLNRIIQENRLKKQYRCICINKPPEGIHKAYLTRNKKNKTVFLKSTASENSREIYTGIKILDYNGKYSLCEVDLLTGRTHQIRAHLAFLGSPVLGDMKYGDMAGNNHLKLKGQYLCAYSLKFADELGNGNTLSYLKGKGFIVEKSKTMDFWQTLK